MGTENYTVAKGTLYIATYTSGTPSWTDIGNCPKMELELTEQSLEHYSSKQAAKELDEEISIIAGYTLNITLDEISAENLKIFMKGTRSGKEIRANTNLNAKWALKFVSDNTNGPNRTTVFHKCKLNPSGAMSFISDEWTSLQLTGKGLSDRTVHSTSPFFTVTLTTTTTTTTTA